MNFCKYLKNTFTLSLYFVCNLQVSPFLFHQEKMNVTVEHDVHHMFAKISVFTFALTLFSQDTRYIDNTLLHDIGVSMI